MYNKVLFLFAVLAFVFSIVAVTYAAEKYNHIPENAFNGCSSLSLFEVQDYVDYIDDYAFEGCTSLERVDFRSSRTIISDSAFSGDDKLCIFCYKNSTAHKYAVDNDIPFELYDYDAVFENSDFDFNSDEHDVITTGVAVKADDSDDITTRSAVIVDGSVTMGCYTLIGDQNNVIEILDGDVKNIYLRSSDELVSSGVIQIALDKDDQAMIYLDVIEDGTEFEITLNGKTSTVVYNAGSYLLTFMGEKEDDTEIWALRVKSGATLVTKFAYAHYTEPVIVPPEDDIPPEDDVPPENEKKYFYLLADVNQSGIIDATDSAIVLSNVQQGIEPFAGYKNVADVMEAVDNEHKIDATDAAKILTKVNNPSDIFERKKSNDLIDKINSKGVFVQYIPIDKETAEGIILYAENEKHIDAIEKGAILVES